MLAGHIAQDGFIDGTSQSELEVGVMPQAHIRETLMGEGFEDGRGHFRHTSLRVVAVIEMPALPRGVFIGDVSLSISQERLSKSLGCLSGDACIQLAFVEVSGVDGQRTIDRLAVFIVSGIAVNGQREFYGHPSSRECGHID